MRKCSSLWIHEPFQERLLDPREASRIKLSLINKLALLWDPCNKPTDAEALYVPSFQLQRLYRAPHAVPDGAPYAVPDGAPHTPAAGFHPDLLVPRDALYACYTMRVFSPNRDEKVRCLGPRSIARNLLVWGQRSCGTKFFNTIKGYFTEPGLNWTLTPEHIRTTWFKCFA
uniref:Uncharacterized protein n=1 Tax=Brassica oleracea var. oleracea TaxID=109376 RepID=A0A0D3D531_BRAOL